MSIPTGKVPQTLQRLDARIPIWRESWGEPVPKVSVLIPSWDGSRGGNVERLLSELREQTVKDVEVLVIVGLRPNGRPRNVGARSARGEFLVSIDDDVVLGNERVLEALITPLEQDPDIGLTGASQTLDSNCGNFQRNVGKQLDRFCWEVPATVIDSDMATHACLAISRRLYFDVGMESDHLIRGTDPDLRRRVRQAGYRVVLVPDVWVYHPLPESLGNLLKMGFRNGFGSSWVQTFEPERVFETGVGPSDVPGSTASLPARVMRACRRTMGDLLKGRTLRLWYRMAYGMGYISQRFGNRFRLAILAKKIGSYAMLIPGYLLAAFKGKASRGIVLVYHRVDRWKSYPLVVTPEAFDEQMKHLKANYQCVSLSEFIERFENGTLETHHVCVTFDDLYEDVYLNAFPILRDNAIPATVFLATDYVRATEQERGAWELPWVRRLGAPNYHLLSWDEIEEMSKAGIDFQAHSCSHRRLSCLNSTQEKTELERSKRLIETRLNQQVRFFAYPFGGKNDFSESTVRLLKQLGYEAAFTAMPGLCISDHSSVWALPRVAVCPEDSFVLFKSKIRGNPGILAVLQLWPLCLIKKLWKL